MKKYMKLLMAALFAALTFSLASCNNDDDDSSDDLSNGLSGVWEGRWTEDGESGTIKLNFKSSSKVIVSETYDQYPEDNFTQEMSYTLDGNPYEGAILKIWGRDVDGYPTTIELYINIDGKTMTCVNDENETVILRKK